MINFQLHNCLQYRGWYHSWYPHPQKNDCFLPLHVHIIYIISIKGYNHDMKAKKQLCKPITLKLDGPSPSALVANTITAMSLERQFEESTSNVWVKKSPLYDADGMLIVSQINWELMAMYTILYRMGDPSIFSLRLKDSWMILLWKYS